MRWGINFLISCLNVLLKNICTIFSEVLKTRVKSHGNKQFDREIKESYYKKKVKKCCGYCE